MASFQPPDVLLLGPGPSPVSRRVLNAMARPTIGHLDPRFVGMMDELKELLRFAMQTRNALTVPISAPGSAGMEAAFVNLVEPGDTVVVCQNGVFGGRMRENVVRIGATPVMVNDAFGTPVDLEKVDAALKAHPGTKALAFVHAETSTGVESDAQALCRLARDHGALSIVDAVTSLGGIPLRTDAWGADAVYSGSQKCLSAPPGLSPLSFSEKAVVALKARKTPVQSWFLDLSLVMGYWQGSGARAYHHTAPINMLYALHEALLILQEEGLDAAFARHRENHLRLKAGLESIGLELLVAEKSRLPQLNAVKVPDGVDEAAIRKRLLSEFGIEIGAGLGELAGKIWRIGLMGAGSNPQSVDRVVEALAVCLARKAA
ncbi:pyridoxal-phosphate-dependent aminotransferase family protein [Dokdonella immobilis]|uniref:Alanine-glyoxylate aminotransferase apoenzyme n=1 Tax=Dokdonella immobilis TaxID=578942 RepID=A0A1I4VXV1_9GAMM|nr:alanine--glyoxylate aminotransferase family protein [Dokdonella immobilis]SFN05980.1 alanine-glyoxylate aminotransferase apoenzyme [Dokdonella immobilis]